MRDAAWSSSQTPSRTWGDIVKGSDVVHSAAPERYICGWNIRPSGNMGQPSSHFSQREVNHLLQPPPPPPVRPPSYMQLLPPPPHPPLPPSTPEKETVQLKGTGAMALIRNRRSCCDSDEPSRRKVSRWSTPEATYTNLNLPGPQLGISQTRLGFPPLQQGAPRTPPETNFASLNCELATRIFYDLFANVSVKFVDTHCHLDLLLTREGCQDKTYAQYREVNSSLFPPSLAAVLSNFCHPELWLRNRALLRRLAAEPGIYISIGVHPKCANAWSGDTRLQLEQSIKEEKAIAVGECGLDFSTGITPAGRQLQLRCFQEQMQMAIKLEKPLICHIRDADDEAFAIMTKTLPRGFLVHFHCFTGSWAAAHRWLDHFPNLYLGFTPYVCFSSEENVELLREVPLDRVLLETDAPYFLPSHLKKAGLLRSVPGLAILVAVSVAKAKRVPLDAVLTRVLANTTRIYSDISV